MGCGKLYIELSCMSVFIVSNFRLYLCCEFLYFFFILVYTQRYVFGFLICIFIISSFVERFFIRALGMWTFFLVKCLFEFFVFLSFVFFLLICYLFGIKVFCLLRFLYFFSFFVVCFWIFFGRRCWGQGGIWREGLWDVVFGYQDCSLGGIVFGVVGE